MNKYREKIAHLYRMLSKQARVLEKMRLSKDEGYRERNMLVAALSKMFPSSLGKHEASDKTWHKEWMTIVYIKLPTGQVSWHLHDSDVVHFAHLKYENEKWDGHTTEEKYKRLLSM